MRDLEELKQLKRVLHTVLKRIEELEKELEVMKTTPVNDRSSYPDVTLEADDPYCDCWDPHKMSYGPHYCPKHNVIIIQPLMIPKDPETITYIINHETLHWLLCRDVSESASDGLDKIPSIEPLI